MCAIVSDLWNTIILLASSVQTRSQTSTAHGHPHSNKTSDCQCFMAVHQGERACSRLVLEGKLQVREFALGLH